MNHTKLSPDDRQRVRKRYASGKTTQAELAREYRVHESTIRRAIHNIAPGEAVPYWLHRRLSDEQMKQLQKRLKAGCGNYAELAREYDVSRTYVSKIALKLGLRARAGRKKP